MNKLLTCVVLAFTCSALSYAQTTSSNSGSVRGTVLDPSGAAVKGATVEIQNPVSHYDQSVQTDAQGKFEFDNIPYNPYHVSALMTGFETAGQDADVRSPLPIEVNVQNENRHIDDHRQVTDAGDLLETDPTAHTDVDRASIRRASSGEPVLFAQFVGDAGFAGVSADSNGLFHGLGDHASNSFSVDGQPITDQQSKVFSNQIPVDAVQSMEVIEGAPPAEYGGKTSLVIVVTTRSGLGVDHAARRYDGLLRHFRFRYWQLRSCLRRGRSGATTFRPADWTQAAFSMARNSAYFTIMATSRIFSIASISSFRTRTRSISILDSHGPGSRRPTRTIAERDRVERAGGG